jgi:diaminohydroxyphosphoribosylaminopyrimidine deaminase/5-amino-6-(5-phosphoribosylamino)uracil reductase
MRILARARSAPRASRAQRAKDFDRAVKEFFMRIALREAEGGVGRTSPNPSVGAVLVKNGRVLGRGFTAPPGGPHAEVRALRAAGAAARGADLYTTLEPCNHWGRTPPCTDAIIAAGVRRVVSASADPNPFVKGQGHRRLRAAGIQVVSGVLEDEAREINAPFFKFLHTGLPWVTLKAAVTFDGKLAAPGGDSRWITGEPARARAHGLRDRVDAVLVGTGTVAHDDPRLTTRLRGKAGHSPVRIVLDTRLRLPGRRQVWRTREARTVVATSAPLTSAKARALARQGVEVWRLPSRSGRVPLRALLRKIAQAGLLHVLIEGGAEVFASAMRGGLVDEVWLFLAPKVLGASGLSWVGDLGVRRMRGAHRLRVKTVERVGDDVLIKAAPH